MQEIEIKILGVNKKELEEKLISLDAKKISESEIFTIFFDTPNKEIHSKKQTFRLRKKGDKVFLTLKNKPKSSNLKIREEIETEVSNFEKTKKIIELLGFQETLSMKKLRTTYKLKNTLFEFDKYLEKYDYIPEFLEIESTDSETIYKYVELLGFKKSDCKNWATGKLIKHYS